MGKERDGPGPSAEFARRHPERVYGGPSPIEFKQRALNMGAAETEAYYGKLPEAHQPPLPRLSRFLGIGGWVFGGSGLVSEAQLTSVACAYMVLYADFGDHEHVFSPVSGA